ncbi:MAG: bifunctional phosphopantothenoylcysteine decarboxylase/phosphopantothenate--cysteine ligase CoaBC, partial [Candidatus Cloacimonetes bacterium]|nr:bifunctional phosphopantothenoylcysteine decarboxylase/phosphopantothenate--cysteine ligase CoaBC [Candidatus Cloacimonadota bacterium]
IVQENISKLRKHNHFVMDTEEGDLACGYSGRGRMASIYEIICAIKTYLHYKQDFRSKKILISAGASIERIDPMRYISNVSTGKMGLSLVRAAYFRGADVTLVYSSLQGELPFYSENIKALSADEMYKKINKCYSKYDIVIMCAAVADFTPLKFSSNKIKKKGDMNLDLIRTTDILSEISKKKKDNQIIVGFAAESEDLEKNAIGKMQKKNLDMIVANSLCTAGESDTEIFIFKRSKENKPINVSGDKYFVANKVLDEIKGE